MGFFRQAALTQNTNVNIYLISDAPLYLQNGKNNTFDQHSLIFWFKFKFKKYNSKTIHLINSATFLAFPLISNKPYGILLIQSSHTVYVYRIKLMKYIECFQTTWYFKQTSKHEKKKIG